MPNVSEMPIAVVTNNQDGPGPGSQDLRGKDM